MGVGPETGRLLAASPLLAQLETLRLNAVQLQAEGLAELVSSPNCRHLKELYLPGNFVAQRAVDDAWDFVGLQALAASAHLGSLCCLDLSDAGLPVQAIEHFVSAKFLPQLEKPFLAGCLLNPQATELLGDPARESLPSTKLDNKFRKVGSPLRLG